MHKEAVYEKALYAYSEMRKLYRKLFVLFVPTATPRLSATLRIVFYSDAYIRIIIKMQFHLLYDINLPQKVFSWKELPECHNHDFIILHSSTTLFPIPCESRLTA